MWTVNLFVLCLSVCGGIAFPPGQLKQSSRYLYLTIFSNKGTFQSHHEAFKNVPKMCKNVGKTFEE
jgi:hypothetical protein